MESAPDLDELVAHWTLMGSERALVDAKHEGSRLGFALMLKGFIARGRFPTSRDDFSSEVVAFVAGQLGGGSEALEAYAWTGRTAMRHRTEVRAFLGFRESSNSDADRLTAWLADEICMTERDASKLRAALVSRSLAELIEPPSEARIDRVK